MYGDAVVIHTRVGQISLMLPSGVGVWFNGVGKLGELILPMCADISTVSMEGLMNTGTVLVLEFS